MGLVRDIDLVVGDDMAVAGFFLLKIVIYNSNAECLSLGRGLHALGIVSHKALIPACLVDVQLGDR